MKKKYEVIRQSLLEQILSGKYTINDKLPTESDLMKQYSASRYTVRQAVSELEGEGYVYKVQGGGIFVNNWEINSDQPLQNKVIGIITTHLANYIFPNIITGIEHTLSDHGYSILLSNTSNDPKRERQALLNMLENNLSGLIIEPTQSALNRQNFDLFQTLKRNNVPTIFINAHYPELDFPFVEVDDTNGTKLLTKQLFDNHHRHVLGVFKTDDFQGVNRMQGFIAAFQEASDETYLSELVMYKTGDQMKKVFEHVSALLMRPDHASAIVCYNDQLAIQLVSLIRSIGLRVPEDISITGFDNYNLSRFLTPTLVTISHPKEQMGRSAGKMMIDLIDGTPVESVVFPATIVDGDSVIPHEIHSKGK